MIISTAKIMLALTSMWSMQEKHEDVLNTYVRAEREAHLDIWLQVPRVMTVSTARYTDVSARMQVRFS
uniref:Uncharacterized protein n=1 Tax=Peronospora matthiolae TaxID=2874970 RepID=A0AAV1T620_9STRA